MIVQRLLERVAVELAVESLLAVGSAEIVAAERFEVEPVEIVVAAESVAVGPVEIVVGSKLPVELAEIVVAVEKFAVESVETVVESMLAVEPTETVVEEHSEFEIAVE